MTDNLMPEPPDRALVGLFDPSGGAPLIFERDDSGRSVQRWFGLDDGEWYRWADVLHIAEFGDEVCRQVVRLYRADDSAVTDAFNAGVEAAAKAIEAHAESIGWYESSGVWADAIEEARKAVKP